MSIQENSFFLGKKHISPHARADATHPLEWGAYIATPPQFFYNSFYL